MTDKEKIFKVNGEKKRGFSKLSLKGLALHVTVRHASPLLFVFVNMYFLWTGLTAFKIMIFLY